MNSLAIPVPSPAPIATSPGSGTTPAADDGKFGDTLRQTRATSETKAQGHVAGHQPSSGQPTADDKKAAGDDRDADPKADAKADDHDTVTADVLPLMAPLPPPAATTTRQMPAAGGKLLPAGTAPVAAARGTPAQARPAEETPAPRADLQPAPAAGGSASAPMTDVPLPLAEPAQPSSHDHGESDAARVAAQDFGSHLGQLLGAHAAQPPQSAPAPAPLQLAMQATPDQLPQFAQETGQNIAWLAGQGIQKAEIQLNPRSLGPIHIEISTRNDHVDVSFAVAHPQTVHALQQTLPHLDQMLAQHGLNLGQASVGQQSQGQHQTTFAQHTGGDSANADSNGTEAETPRNWRPLRIATPGRVDDFA